MRLTWKDGAATLVMAVAVAVYLVFLGGTSLPVISGVRGAAAVLLVLGIAGCSLGRQADGFRGGWGLAKVYVVTMTVLGMTALAAALGALIVGSPFALAVQFFAIFTLWLLATLRHAVANAEYTPPDARDTHETIDERTRAH